MAVCAETSVGFRGRILESDLFESCDLWTMQEMFDGFNADGFRTTGWWKVGFVFDGHAEHDMQASVAVYMRALCLLYSLLVGNVL
jgi:hypothetical protein